MAESSQNEEKTLWKRRNCSLRAISAFPTFFFSPKHLYCRQLKPGLVWEMVKRTGIVPTKHPQEHSMSFSPDFMNLNVTQLLNGQSEVVLLSNASKYGKI